MQAALKECCRELSWRSRACGAGRALALVHVAARCRRMVRGRSAPFAPVQGDRGAVQRDLPQLSAERILWAFEEPSARGPACGFVVSVTRGIQFGASPSRSGFNGAAEEHVGAAKRDAGIAHGLHGKALIHSLQHADSGAVRPASLLSHGVAEEICLADRLVLVPTAASRQEHWAQRELAALISARLCAARACCQRL